MTVEASPKGWIIRVTTKRLSGGPPSVEIYDVAIPDPAEAMDAVRRVCRAGPGTVVETIAELPSGTELRAGEVLAR
jgi:hypothetical protein